MAEAGLKHWHPVAMLLTAKTTLFCRSMNICVMSVWPLSASLLSSWPITLLLSLFHTYWPSFSSFNCQALSGVRNSSRLCPLFSWLRPPSHSSFRLQLPCHFLRTVLRFPQARSIPCYLSSQYLCSFFKVLHLTHSTQNGSCLKTEPYHPQPTASLAFCSVPDTVDAQ